MLGKMGAIKTKLTNSQKMVIWCYYNGLQIEFFSSVHQCH